MRFEAVARGLVEDLACLRYAVTEHRRAVTGAAHVEGNTSDV